MTQQTTAEYVRMCLDNQHAVDLRSCNSEEEALVSWSHNQALRGILRVVLGVDPSDPNPIIPFLPSYEGCEYRKNWLENGDRRDPENHFVAIDDGNAGRARLIGPMTEGEAEACAERLNGILAARPFLDKRIYVDTAVPETEEEVTREWLEMEADPIEHDSEEPAFADPTGVSALRAAGPDNPRNLPCPTCGGANRLTPKDVALGYQCDTCAERLERGDY